MTTLGAYLESQGFSVDDSNVPYGRESTWRGVNFLMVHHTVSDCDGSESSIANYVRNGGSGTYPPLAQITLGGSGKVWMCSKERSGQSDPGRASHAGSGSGYGVPTDTMNEQALGIECQCDGSHSLATHETLYNTLIRLLAVLSLRYDVPVENIIGHKEWSSTGKVDPKDSMDTIRSHVAAELNTAGENGPFVTRDVYRSKCGFGEPTNGDDSSDTVKELQERLNRFGPDDRELTVNGVYLEATDSAVRAWQDSIGDVPDDPYKSFLGPMQFELMFPDSVYNLHDDGDPAVAIPETVDPEPAPPEVKGIVQQLGLWKWYSGKEDSKVKVYPDGDWHDIDLDAQPASNITANNVEEHFLYLRIQLPAGRSATRTIETHFQRSDGDETAYKSPAWDAGAKDSIAYENFHTESGSGLGGKWKIKVTGGTDPISYTTRYAKAFVTYQDPIEIAQSAIMGTYQLASRAGARLIKWLTGTSSP